jgi:hypothetical protein
LGFYSYRFFFYSNDHDPSHIHVEKDGKIAKYNLKPIELKRSSRYNAKELKEMRKLIEENIDLLVSKWNEYLNNN